MESRIERKDSSSGEVGSNEEAEEKTCCGVCKAPCEKFCSGCKKIYYCSVDHQKSHRKEHKKDCFPGVLKSDESFGRFFVASRNIKQGELIFKDTALVSGPSGAELFFHPICLGCYRQVKKTSAGTSYKCSKCSWPLCSKQCEDMNHHAEYECKVFSQNKVIPYFNKPYQYELINTLRSLLLILNEPEKWGELEKLASHSEARAKSFAAMRSVKEAVEFIHSKCKLQAQFDPLVIDHVVGVWGINSFGANPPAGPNPGRARMATLLFPKLCLAAHSCMPNTRGILIEDAKSFNPSYSMELVASLPIKEGEQINTTYANVNEGTFERRLVLRDNYYFRCECKRCSDPSELGTFFSAFKCTKCDIGYLLPFDPLDIETPWICISETCSNKSSYTELKIILKRIQRELHKVENEASIDVITQLENILYKNQRQTVNNNHWLMIETEFLLAMRILGYLPKCTKPEEEDLLLNRLTEICEHCLFVADLIQPGHNSYRGKLLYCLSQAKLKQIVKGTKTKGIETILQSKDELLSIRRHSREAMEILSREPPGTEDNTLSQRLAKDMLQVQSLVEFVNQNEAHGKS